MRSRTQAKYRSFIAHRQAGTRRSPRYLTIVGRRPETRRRRGISGRPSRRPQWRTSIVDQVPQARAKVVTAGMEREDRREPEQPDADQGGDRQDAVAGLAGDQEADGEQLQE